MGATSHIAKGLIDKFLQQGNNNLFLFSRSPAKVRLFLKEIGQIENQSYIISADYASFLSFNFDVIINCVGVETRNKHNCDFTRYFTVTEEFDNLALNYLKNRNPGALYISFSSGAVYGKGFSNPVEDNSVNNIKVNHVAPEDYYGIVRIYTEAKHRSHKELRIIDLRIFSYFSRYITLSDGYFITDVIEAVLENKLLITDNSNIIRDYLHPDDLFDVIQKCIKAGKINQAIDIKSSEPVSKEQILNYFSQNYGLKYKSIDSRENASATGAKSNYYSVCNTSSLIGYIPNYSSMDTIKHESEIILKK
jgi:nucleoside-diphosphate-sugar epimerase